MLVLRILGILAVIVCFEKPRSRAKSPVVHF
jgi:hypothetical protein